MLTLARLEWDAIVRELESAPETAEISRPATAALRAALGSHASDPEAMVTIAQPPLSWSPHHRGSRPERAVQAGPAANGRATARPDGHAGQKRSGRLGGRGRLDRAAQVAHGQRGCRPHTGEPELVGRGALPRHCDVGPALGRKERSVSPS